MASTLRPSCSRSPRGKGLDSWSRPGALEFEIQRSNAVGLVGVQAAEPVVRAAAAERQESPEDPSPTVVAPPVGARGTVRRMEGNRTPRRWHS